MRIKLFFLLLLPFMMFAEKPLINFSAGDQYIYDAKYHVSEGNTRCYRIIYDVLSVDENGVALVSCSSQGQKPLFIVGYSYNVLITPEKKIFMEKPWCCYDLKWEMRSREQVEFYLFPLEYYRKKGWSNFHQDGNIYSFEEKSKSLCCNYVSFCELIMDPKSGLALQFRISNEERQYFEVSRQDQSE